MPYYIILFIFIFRPHDLKHRMFLTFTNNWIDVAIAFTLSPRSSHFLLSQQLQVLSWIVQSVTTDIPMTLQIFVSGHPIICLMYCCPDFYNNFLCNCVPLFRTISGFLKWFYLIQALILFRIAFGLYIDASFKQLISIGLGCIGILGKAQVIFQVIRITLFAK